MQGDRQFKSQVIPLWSYPMLKYLPWHLFPSLLNRSDCELYFYKSDGALTSEFFFKLHVANHILKCFEMYPNQICHRQPYCQILNVFKLSKSSNLSSPTIFWSQHSLACRELSNNKFSKSFQMYPNTSKKINVFCQFVSRYVQIFSIAPIKGFQKFLIIVKCWQKIKMLRIISNLSKH